MSILTAPSRHQAGRPHMAPIYALLLATAASSSVAHAAEHTLMPTPQTVHIGYFSPA